MRSVYFEEEKKVEDEPSVGQKSHVAPVVTPTPPHPTAPPTNNTASRRRRPNSFAMRLAGHTLRTILLDIPLLAILLALVVSTCFNYISNTYLLPQYFAMSIDDTRKATEMTYYVRDCSPDDLSTTNGMELFLPADASIDDAYEHQLKHGFTVFRSAMTADTATELRDYIAAKNYNLTEQESIYVIENKNRYSFGLSTEVPVVAKAVKELTNHALLRGSVEKILGPDPALIEMTAITIAYGAIDQWWHDDVIPTGSPIRHGRAFGPSYSIFVQLQNTTKEMGSTAGCPGTHYCSGGSEHDVCSENGFQLVNEEGHWAAGDALLMNMNSWHRGSAHTDPNAPDRVMLILTLVPKPKDFAESRRMSQGITFSMRWDMWGHTWEDLAHADGRMSQPWATLRSLALWKPKEACWGVDYFTSSSMRAIGYETGFNDEAMEDFQRWGQLSWLPMWLQEQGLDPYEDDVWMKYVTRTAKKVQNFLELVVFVAISSYVVFFALYAIVQTKRSWIHSFSLSMFRLATFCTLAYVLTKSFHDHVDSTRWAADIRGGRRFSSVFENEIAFGVKTEGITTLPFRNDVLIENRFGSRYLHMYNDYINGHPGNRYFLGLVNAVSPTFSSYPGWLQDASACYIARSVLTADGRFLEQGQHGNWYLIDFEEAMEHTKKELVSRSMPLVGVVLQELRYIVSGYRFSTLRDTSMAQHHLGPYMQELQRKIVKTALKASDQATSNNRDIRPPETQPLMDEDKVTVLKFQSPVPKATASSAFKVSSSVKAPRSAATRSIRTAPNKMIPTEPEPGAWFATGSRLEAFTEGFWFMGYVEHVSAFGQYFVKFPDGDEGLFVADFLRVFEPYQVGERLQLYQDGFDDYQDCQIVAKEEDGTFHAILARSNEYFDNIEPSYFRRYQNGRIRAKTYMGAY